MLTGADDARVEHREVLLAGGEGGDAEGAAGLGAAAHPPLRGGTGTFSGCSQRTNMHRNRCLDPKCSPRIQRDISDPRQHEGKKKKKKTDLVAVAMVCGSQVATLTQE